MIFTVTGDAKVRKKRCFLSQQIFLNAKFLLLNSTQTESVIRSNWQLILGEYQVPRTESTNIESKNQLKPSLLTSSLLFFLGGGLELLFSFCTQVTVKQPFKKSSFLTTTHVRKHGIYIRNLCSCRELPWTKHGKIYFATTVWSVPFDGLLLIRWFLGATCDTVPSFQTSRKGASGFSRANQPERRGSNFILLAAISFVGTPFPRKKTLHAEIRAWHIP